MCFFCEGVCDHRELHVLTHSLPTRRSADLITGARLSVARDIASRRVVDDVLAETHRNPARNEVAPDATMGASHLADRSEEHTSELQSLMRISYAVLCL